MIFDNYFIKGIIIGIIFGVPAGVVGVLTKTIERLNGTIHAENADNKGLSIIITLVGKEGTLYGKNTDY